MSPTAIVLAGGGVALGEVAHLGLAVAVVLGAAGYGARLAWAAVHRRVELQRRARSREVHIDPWSVPEPWRGYTARALDAQKRLRQLATDSPPGPVTNYLANAIVKVEPSVEELWALAKSGAALAEPAGRSAKVASELTEVQDELRAGQGGDRAVLSGREDALASELRSLRQTETVSAQISSQLSALCAQLEGLVARAGQLVGASGTASTDLSSLSSELDSLSGALEEARRIMSSSPPAP